VCITDPVAEKLFEFLKKALYDPDEARLDLEEIPEGFVDLAKGLLYYVQSVHEASILAADIARGDLDTNPLTTNNEVAPGLKSLQATLRHLTWQSQQIAKGDYQQRINFMGDFSEAVNNMVVQLDERQKALEEEIAAGVRKSEALALNLKVLEDITKQMTQLVIVVDIKTEERLFQNHPIERVLYDLATADQLHEWMHNNLSSIEVDTRVTRDIELINNDSFQFFTADIRALAWGTSIAAVFIFSDMTQTRRAMASLEAIANYDQQTGVYSRHYGMITLNKWLDQGMEFSLCFADMDSLKLVNDKFGHGEGDKYILEVSGILRSFSQDAFVCRLGGDEFMLLAKSWTQEAAESRLEDLRSELIRMGEKFDPRYQHSLSYGVIEVSKDTRLPLSDLLSTADERMYLYKRARKAERKN
jgi:diguanylate cyclase (GGDEF)-like protein